MKPTGARDATIALDRLTVFAAVAEAKSFANAARGLGLQRSSISRNIAALEATLGVSLFQRSTRVVTLTPEGATLHAQVRPQLLALREAVRSLRDAETEIAGTLRLTATVDLGTTLLPPIIAGFMQRYPAVRVELAIHNRLVDLVGEQFDAALRPQPTERADSSLVSRKLLELVGNVYASPTYLAARGTPRTLDDLPAHDWVSFRGRPLPRPAPRMPPPRITVDEMLFMREALGLGLGLGILPMHLAQPEVLAGRLVRVLPRQIVFRGGLYLIHAPTRHLPRRLAAFRDHFLEHARTPTAAA